jgi:hypothetical protein
MLQRLRLCIGAAFVNEGQSRFISWAFPDQAWQANPAVEAYMREHPLPAVNEEFVPRYRLKPA